MTLRVRAALLCWLILAMGGIALPRAASATALPGPLLRLQRELATLRAPGRVGIAVEDLATGYVSGVNAGANLPAASTIKIPVMIEVFKQMERGALDLRTIVHLENRDRDYGWGDLAYAPAGDAKSVKALLWLMITDSDNTATNMLIRRVGRRRINRTMASLGLRVTRLTADIRSDSESVRYGLRTSPREMVTLLDRIARERMIDPWASREMLAILDGQRHNGLLPAPLPKAVKIAHKTGSLHDTLNDVGIVYRDDEPYVIAVMTTRLPDLDLGRAFIRRVSELAYTSLCGFANWRRSAGITAFSMDRPAPPDLPLAALAPDARMWESSPASATL